MPSPEWISNLAQVGVDARWTALHGTAEVEAPCCVKHMQLFGHCTIGAFTYADHSVDIYNADIGRYCSIGSGVRINPGRHPTDFLSTHPFVMIDPSPCGLGDDPMLQGISATACIRPAGKEGPTRVTIGNDVWIGTGAIILTGVTVGTGAVIGAGAVVTRDVAPYDVVGGSPARVIRSRFAPELVERLLASRWWDRDLSVLTQRDYSDAACMLDQLDVAQVAPFKPKVMQLAA